MYLIQCHDNNDSEHGVCLQSQTVQSVTFKVFGLLGYEIVILYTVSWKICHGGLAVFLTTPKLKSAKISYSHIRIYIRTAILYRTAKSKSANILSYTVVLIIHVVLGPHWEWSSVSIQ